MKSGIYHIVCRKTGRVYVGQSIDISQRWSQHLSALTAGNHANKLMQEDFILNGSGGFYFVVREYCHQSLLDYAEAREIDTLMAIGVEVFNEVIPDPTTKTASIVANPASTETLYHLCKKHSLSPQSAIDLALTEKLRRDAGYIDDFFCIKTKLPQSMNDVVSTGKAGLLP